MSGQTDFHWYASDNAETYSIGPENSREDVIEAARRDELGFQEADEEGPARLVFYIVEANKTVLTAADWILPRDLFEAALERLSDSDHCDEYGECNGAFECTAEQERDLRNRLRAACDEWQQVHGLRWVSWGFSESRNEELIELPLEPECGDA